MTLFSPKQLLIASICGPSFASSLLMQINRFEMGDKKKSISVFCIWLFLVPFAYVISLLVTSGSPYYLLFGIAIGDGVRHYNYIFKKQIGDVDYVAVDNFFYCLILLISLCYFFLWKIVIDNLLY